LVPAKSSSRSAEGLEESAEKDKNRIRAEFTLGRGGAGGFNFDEKVLWQVRRSEKEEITQFSE